MTSGALLRCAHSSQGCNVSPRRSAASRLSGLYQRAIHKLPNLQKHLPASWPLGMAQQTDYKKTSVKPSATESMRNEARLKEQATAIIVSPASVRRPLPTAGMAAGHSEKRILPRSDYISPCVAFIHPWPFALPAMLEDNDLKSNSGVGRARPVDVSSISPSRLSKDAPFRL